MVWCPCFIVLHFLSIRKHLSHITKVSGSSTSRNKPLSQTENFRFNRVKCKWNAWIKWKFSGTNGQPSDRRYSTFSVRIGWNRNYRSICTELPFLPLARANASSAENGGNFLPPFLLYQWYCMFRTENEALRVDEKSLSILLYHGNVNFYI